jgi:hypothetical protein
MAENIRYIDSLKVGAYETDTQGVTILNNLDHYVITATGTEQTVRGNPELYFDNLNLGIGTQSPVARLEVNHNNSVDDILIIKHSDNNTGFKVNIEGTFLLLEFSSLPTAITGGVAYSNDNFWLGVVS